MPTSAGIVSIARQFLFVREATGNTGRRVEVIQRWCGGQKGEPWCAYWVTLVLDLAFAGEAPISRQGSCQAIRDVAEDKGWIRTAPAVGDLFLYVNKQNRAHHIGIVTEVGAEPHTSRATFVGIAGNTSRDGKSSNGDGVYERAVRAPVFIAYPRE